MKESSHHKVQKSNLLLQTHRRNGSSSAVSIAEELRLRAADPSSTTICFLSSLIKKEYKIRLSLAMRHLTLQHRALPDCSFRHRQIMCCGDW